ncbi:glucose-6-phosphate isomerase [hydrocarbon metagenome]|uniref:Glucose-6-phosphate isomerase n=1 Tax=hydrocarbon metagenome TaxID=938273 RepID=A0A0W8FYH3_9ZZZZ
MKKYKIPTTFGFGPRFLHSTGQLHKGDDGSGIFIQFIKSGNINLPIPDDARSNDSSITFDVLIKAQALGDREALLQNNRKVITFDINGSVQETIKKIIKVIQ